MTDRQSLLKKIQMWDFNLNDARLFLDTHPESTEAINYFNDCLHNWNKAMDSYTAKYGPLNQHDYVEGDRWDWVDSPWPWEWRY